MQTIRRNLVSLAVAMALVLGFVAGHAFGYQEHMQNAKSHLISARNQLNEASSDKAGHRVNALRLVNDAINETEMGIQAGRR